MIKLYLLLNFFVAWVVFIESVEIYRQEGKFGDNKLLYLSSFVEFVWVFASAAALYYSKFPEEFIFMPVIYIGYNVLGWLVGLSLYSKNEKYRNIEDLVIPASFVKFGMFFGFNYMVVSAYVFLQYSQYFYFS